LIQRLFASVFISGRREKQSNAECLFDIIYYNSKQQSFVLFPTAADYKTRTTRNADEQRGASNFSPCGFLNALLSTKIKKNSTRSSSHRAS